jgi:hypothetical protein
MGIRPRRTAVENCPINELVGFVEVEEIFTVKGMIFTSSADGVAVHEHGSEL